MDKLQQNFLPLLTESLRLRPDQWDLSLDELTMEDQAFIYGGLTYHQNLPPNAPRRSRTPQPRKVVFTNDALNLVIESTVMLYYNGVLGEMNENGDIRIGIVSVENEEYYTEYYDLAPMLTLKEWFQLRAVLQEFCLKRAESLAEKEERAIRYRAEDGARRLTNILKG